MAKDGNEQGSGKMGINTRLAHSGNNPHDYFGFVNPPVVHASTVLFRNAAAMAGRNQKYTYGTRGTPTTLMISWPSFVGILSPGRATTRLM